MAKLKHRWVWDEDAAAARGPAAVSLAGPDSAYAPSPVHDLQQTLAAGLSRDTSATVADDRWPRATRLGLLVTMGVASWALVIGAVALVF